MASCAARSSTSFNGRPPSRYRKLKAVGMRRLEKAQWIEVYEALEKPLYNVVYRVIWDASASQDIVQEAFLRCWKKRAEIRADGFKALLFRTALNLALNQRRRDRLWRLVGLASADDASAPDGCEEPIPKSVRDAIDALPARLKEALLLTELAGMTYAEAGMTLGIKEGTVGSRRTRALAILRRRLDVEGGSDES